MEKHTFFLMYDPDRENLRVTCTEEGAVTIAHILAGENRVIVAAETAGTGVATIPQRSTHIATRIAVAEMLDQPTGG